jgi:uncharacterized protein (TIGR02246 family)
MKKFLTVAAVIFCAVPLYAGRGDAGGADEQAIRQLYASYDAIWDKADAKAMAQFWAEDAYHVEPDGRVVTGRAAIAKELADRFATDLKGTRSKQTLDGVHFIKPDVAVVDASYEVTGMQDAEAKLLPPLQGRYIDIWVKKGGKWHIVTDRPVAALHPSK